MILEKIPRDEEKESSSTSRNLVFFVVIFLAAGGLFSNIVQAPTIFFVNLAWTCERRDDSVVGGFGKKVPEKKKETDVGLRNRYPDVCLLPSGPSSLSLSSRAR